jgi:hypothetical protein
LIDFRRERGNILEFIEFFQIIYDYCREIIWEQAQLPPIRHEATKKTINTKFFEQKPNSRCERVNSLKVKGEICKSPFTENSPVSLRKYSAPNESGYDLLAIRPSLSMDVPSDAEDSRNDKCDNVSFHSSKRLSTSNIGVKLFQAKTIVDVRKKSIT